MAIKKTEGWEKEEVWMVHAPPASFHPSILPRFYLPMFTL